MLCFPHPGRSSPVWHGTCLSEPSGASESACGGSGAVPVHLNAELGDAEVGMRIAHGKFFAGNLWTRLSAGIVLAACATGTAWAEEAPKLDKADTAWMLTSTALVLMMTVPGLALFYG